MTFETMNFPYVDGANVFAALPQNTFSRSYT